jgi:23S rRNA (cytidine1920-2'-O)/16S rRNA (cytidine1409-2'-O)-methyltransferase
VLDLSYLSLTDALPLAADLLAPDGDILALFKPLFEIDNSEARRTGRIQDATLIVSALHRVLDVGNQIGVQPKGVGKLALRPRYGVSEYFLHFAAGAGGEIWRYNTETLTGIVTSTGIGKEQEDMP